MGGRLVAAAVLVVGALAPMSSVAAEPLASAPQPAGATATSATVSGGVLTVIGSADEDDMVVDCQAGMTKVDGLDPSTGAIACTQITRVVMQGLASDDDLEVDDDGFTGLASTRLVGGGGQDFLLGTSVKDTLLGGGGAGDDLRGYEGKDVFDGGKGEADAASTTIAGKATVLRTVVKDGAVKESLKNIEEAGVSGGAGNDTIDASEYPGVVSLLGGLGGEDLLIGGPRADHLYGGNGATEDTLKGGKGNDTLTGFGGDDLLDGGRGRDQVSDDLLVGPTTLTATALMDGADVDTLVSIEEARLITIDNTGWVADASAFPGPVDLWGRDGPDILTGGGNDDELLGYNGDDTLNGGGGNDMLFGHSNDDTLNGGSGDDLLNGGLDTDACDGGLGINTVTSCEA